MYGIFTYIWLIFMVNVGKYTIHGSSGIYTIENEHVPKRGTISKGTIDASRDMLIIKKQCPWESKPTIN